MNAETRAKELFIAVMEAPIRSEAEAIIKAHLIAAENDKLEEAAQQIDGQASYGGLCDRGPTYVTAMNEAARISRSLKSKD